MAPTDVSSNNGEPKQTAATLFREVTEHLRDLNNTAFTLLPPEKQHKVRTLRDIHKRGDKEITGSDRAALEEALDARLAAATEYVSDIRRALFFPFSVPHLPTLALDRGSQRSFLLR
jgi:hypothetical protein